MLGCSAEEKETLKCSRNYTCTIRGWHVENESAFSAGRKGT
jgi:hypothetical protein